MCIFGNDSEWQHGHMGWSARWYGTDLWLLQVREHQRQRASLHLQPPEEK